MIARAWLAPGYGLALGTCYAISWLVLGRALTPRVLMAVGFIAAAGTTAAILAGAGAFLLRGRPWTARFAAALVTSSAGTVGLTALLLGLERAWATHPMAELPVHVGLFVVASLTAAALYNVLALAAFLLLPLGLPATFLFAMALARRP